jgi:hypothetical protein
MIEIIIVLIVCICIVCSISSATGTGVGAYLYTSVDGGWSEWKNGKCDLDCGGERIRTRQCNDPKPFANGLDCEGEKEEILDCAPCLTKEDIIKEAEKTALENKKDAEAELQLVMIKQTNDAEAAKQKAKQKAIEDDILTIKDLTNAGVSFSDAEFLLENLEDHKDDSTFITKIKKDIYVLLNESPRYQENKNRVFYISKTVSLNKIIQNLRIGVKGNKREVIPLMGTLGNSLYELSCIGDSHVTEINGSYDSYIRDFGIKCSDGKSLSAPRISNEANTKAGKLATRFLYNRNNGFDKITIHAGSVIDGIKIGDNLSGGTGGNHLSKQCNNGRIIGFVGTSRTDDLLSGIGIICDKKGIFSSGNISFNTIKPVPAPAPAPAPVPVPVETIVKFNTIIQIAKNSSHGHKLGLLSGKAFETTGSGQETQLILISTKGKTGEVHYNDELIVAKWHGTFARLKLKSGNAYEVSNELSEHTMLKIVGWTGNETGPVKLGNKVWIEKNGKYQLSLFGGKASELKTDKHKDQTQMIIVNF